MPRYYFNLYKGDAITPDEEGLELEDQVVAKREAMESLRELIADLLSETLEPLDVTVEIRQEGVGIIDRVTGQVTIAPPIKA